MSKSTSTATPGTDRLKWPAPKDWQAFERLCRALWRRVWQVPTVVAHGRSGQNQRGVDLYATLDNGTGIHGLQCKCVDVLTEAEMLEAVERAKAFEPPLCELIIATTAPSNVQLQAVARRISEVHAKQSLFSVHLLGWSDILALMAEHRDVMVLAYPEFFVEPGQPHLDDSRETLTVTRAAQMQAELLIGQRSLQQQLVQLSARLISPASEPVHVKLDVCRELLFDHHYRAALKLLGRLEQDEGETSNARVRHRIAANQGFAHLGLGDNVRAGECLLRALTFDSTDETALSARALGLSLLGRLEEAFATAREALDQQPLSLAAWTAYLQVLTSLDPQPPLPEIPQAIAQDPGILSLLAWWLTHEGRWSEAEQILRQLIALPAFDPMVPARLADIITIQVLGGKRLRRASPYSAADLARLAEAERLLADTWNGLKRSEDATTSLEALLSLCRVRVLLGQMPAAEGAIDEALVLVGDLPALWVWKIQMANAMGDGALALRLLGRIPSAATPEYTLLAAGAYRAAKESARAAALLEEYLIEAPRNGMPDPRKSEEARLMLAELLCECDLAHAKARFDALPEAGTLRGARVTSAFARALRKAGAVAAGEHYLALARETLASSLDAEDRLSLADALAEFDQWEAALAIYEKDVDTQLDTHSLGEYVRGLIQLKQWRRLFDLLASLPVELSGKPFYEWVRADLAVRIGDYSVARAAAESYLVCEPSNFSMQLMRVEVCMRLGDSAAAQAWLSALPPTLGERTLDQLLRLRRLYHVLGRGDEASATAYETLRRFPNEPRAHLGFYASRLPRSCAVSGPDTAVCLRGADGHERIYILEDRPQSELLPDEVSVASPFGKRLLGCKVGEAVPGYGLEVPESTLVAIEHKYWPALRASIKGFHGRFPDHPGLGSVKLPVSETPQEQVELVLRVLQEKAGQVKEVEGLLQRGWAISMVADRLGRSSREVWQSLRGNRSEPIAVFQGRAEEGAAWEALMKTPTPPRVLIEPLALWQLHQLKILPVIAATFGKIALVEATLDELRDQLVELELYHEGYLRISKRESQYRVVRVTARAAAAERRQIQSLLEWARKHCEVLTALSTVDPPPETAKGLEHGWGSAVYGSLLAAQAHRYVLISDDFNLRGIAKSLLGIEGLWIQSVLVKAMQREFLKSEHYYRAVSRLVAWCHDFTSVDADILFLAAKCHGWKVSAEFETLATTLQRTHPTEHTRMCVPFLRAVWGTAAGATLSQATALTNTLLKCMGPCTSVRGETFLRELHRATVNKMLPEPAWKAIVAWCRDQKWVVILLP